MFLKSKPAKQFQLSSIFLIALSCNVQATLVDLNFSNVYGEGSPPPTEVTGQVIEFLDVATFGTTNVDARVTATAYGDYTFSHHNPAYKQGVGGPEDDLGFIYTTSSTSGVTSGGMTYTLEFFEGVGSGFGSSAITLSEVDLAIYDVDGENYQLERLRTFIADGLASYQVGDGSVSLIPTYENNNKELLFTGQRHNVPEDDPQAAVILHYSNVDSITLKFETETYNGGPFDSDVFSALDGNASMFNGGGGGFIPPENVVPEPSSTSMLSLFVIVLLFRRSAKKY